MNESNMDPDDWNAFRRLAHEMLDTMLDQFSQLEDKPTWREPPREIVESIQHQALPRKGIGERKAFEEFCEKILPYGNGSWHPRFLGWVQGTGMPMGMLADMLASGLNTHMAGFNTVPKWIELQVITWVAEMVGMPAESSGLLTTGGSMANILAIHVAREAFKNREGGMTQGAAPSKLTLYASDQTHGWLKKGIRFLGMDQEVWRIVPSDEDGRIDLCQLRKEILADQQAGRTPWLVCGNVGTVHTGAIDDMSGIADLCEEYRLWFHVDGAFGALANQIDEYRPQLEAMAKADSLAVDLHKWMYLPFDIGAVLIRDQVKHLAAFASSQVYMDKTDRGLLSGGVPLADRGIELTRSFRALKAWMTLRAYGMDRFVACIQKNIDQARYMERLIKAHPQLELLAPVPLNIVCFRYTSGRPCDTEQLNQLNRELLLRFQESGEGVLSSTLLGDRFAIRAAITNHRTRNLDFDRILRAIVAIGDQIANRAGEWNEAMINDE